MQPVPWQLKLGEAAVMLTDPKVQFSGTNSSTEGFENTLKRRDSKNERRAAVLLVRNALPNKSNKRFKSKDLHLHLILMNLKGLR